MNLLLDRGANVLIVNNKGQSVYSIACSHFESELIERIKQIEIQQEDETKELKGWVDYKKSHPDGNVYGDSDLRFLGRPLTDADVVEDGVVNPTTKESRKGNFARNNPHALKRDKMKLAAKAAKKKERASVAITEDEQEQLDATWDQVHLSIASGDSWGVFSSLLSIVQLMEGKKLQYSWVEECACHLDFLMRLVEDTLSSLESSKALNAVLSEAIVCCGSGDRHATLTKRILTNALEGPNHSNSLTDQEKRLIGQLWNDAELALKGNCSRNAFDSLIKIVIFGIQKTSNG